MSGEREPDRVVDGDDVLGYRCPNCETIVTAEAKARAHCENPDSSDTGVDSPPEGRSRDTNPGCEAGESPPRAGAPARPDTVDDETDGAHGEGGVGHPTAGEWDHADFASPDSDTWPATLVEHRCWLVRRRGSKQPFAPWGERDHPDVDDEKDARYSWSVAEHWTDKETADEWVEMHPGLEGYAVILDSETDPYTDEPDSVALVDGDDVRCPETGEVHPAYVELLARLGLTYADVSRSDSGIHALYEGRLPDDVKRAAFAIDDEPWGANDEAPSVEIYDGKRVCVVTGEHVPGTPADVRPWDESALTAILDEHVPESDRHTPASHDTDTENPLDDYEPTVTGPRESTDEIRDVFYAVENLRPADLPLRTSKVGEEGGSDGWEKWDPSSYRTSSGGDSLHRPAGENVFYDQKTAHTFGLLALFAAERGILSKPWHDLSGSTWWDAVEAARDAGAPIPEFDGSTDGEQRDDVEPVSVLPLAQLGALRPDERRRAARKRGLEWPTTDELRDRLRDRILAAVANGEDVVIPAPTGAGKSFTVASEEWRDLPDVTDGSPVIHLHETCEARDSAFEDTDEHGGEGTVLRGRPEACPVARGAHDPDEEREIDVQTITIDGQPASAWLDEQCDEKGVPFSAAHAYLDEHNDQDAPLPCCPPVDDSPDAARQVCPAVAQWQGVPRDDEGEPSHDVVHATHNFAHVPGLAQDSIVFVDEQPDYTVGLAQDRVRRAVGAYLAEIDAPVTTFEAFVALARGDTGGDETALATALDEREPDREWYIAHPDAHTLAPAIARGLWYALREDRNTNGRRSATVTHHPPRLDADARDDDTWNREFVTVVVDEQNDVRRIRAAPDLSGARCVIGLDAHPTPSLWQRNTRPNIRVDPLLDTDERRLWRRFERGLTVVQVGDATRPAGGEGKHAKADRGREPFVRHLREHYGSAFATAITDSHSEEQLTQLMLDAGVRADRLDTMHFGEEKSRNDFAGESVGAVLGCIDAGDDYVLDTLAEHGLDARPEYLGLDVECPACGDGGEGKIDRRQADPLAFTSEDCETCRCEECRGTGCRRCNGTGRTRAFGRGFVGPDADTADSLVASVRENHVAQAAGRYARNADAPDDVATVFVRTDAVPVGFADYQVEGVTHVAGEKQRAVAEAAREHPGATARELREHASDRLGGDETVSKRHVATTLAGFLERGVIQRRRGAGAFGGDEWDAAGLSDAAIAGDVSEGLVDAIANSPSWDLLEYQFVITDLGASTTSPATADGEGSLAPELADGGDRPPDGPG